ncbi:MAG: IPT/TIG domain-containing protein [Bacteroidota bacterium]|nr:IPT/TIG domain-containing protein [Bacteroidota bacterium]MDP4213964.1 IPT/TIG domain-containing protein [Bacteroidota bacterium]MDP4248989.1 IPT/TIG domain-containing protein [Bacteroidota bacterium]
MKIVRVIKTGLLFSFIPVVFALCKKTNTTISDYKVEITSINPGSGNNNTAVTLKGKGFSLVLTEDTVKFNGKIAQITQSTDSTILAYAPAGGTTGNVTLSIRDQLVAGPVFTYLASPVSITGISPTSGQAGVQVTITGSQFVTDTSKDLVYFNGVRAAVVSARTTTMVVIAPNSTTGPVSVTVNGNTASGPVFTYTVPAPVITNVVYNGLFAITGQHFDPQASVVKIGGQTVTGFNFTDLGNGQAQLVHQNFIPASNLDNPAPVTVTVSNVTSNVYSFLFAPVINSVSPDTVSVNDNVTLQGMLFGNRTVASSVKAFYFDQGGNKTYMTPDPVVVSWNTNAIQVTMQDYGSYPIGSGGTPFDLEVNVGARSGNIQVRFHIL